MDEAGQVKRGCKIVPKGVVYDRKIFTTKDSKFKNEAFLNEIKNSFTELMNIYVKDKKEKLQVFDKNSPYLAMKKVGKNNPKDEQIESDNGGSKGGIKQWTGHQQAGQQKKKLWVLNKQKLWIRQRVLFKTGQTSTVFYGNCPVSDFCATDFDYSNIKTDLSGVY